MAVFGSCMGGVPMAPAGVLAVSVVVLILMEALSCASLLFSNWQCCVIVFSSDNSAPTNPFWLPNSSFVLKSSVSSSPVPHMTPPSAVDASLFCPSSPPSHALSSSRRAVSLRFFPDGTSDGMVSSSIPADAAAILCFGVKSSSDLCRLYRLPPGPSFPPRWSLAFCSPSTVNIRNWFKFASISWYIEFHALNAQLEYRF